MKTELQAYAESFEAELVAFRTLSTSDFIKKYLSRSFHEDEYGEDDCNDMINDYFSCLEIVTYKNDNYNYFEICLGCGGPNVYLNIHNRWKSVEYIIGWGGESYSKDLSYLYDTITELYSLELY